MQRQSLCHSCPSSHRLLHCCRFPWIHWLALRCSKSRPRVMKGLPDWHCWDASQAAYFLRVRKASSDVCRPINGRGTSDVADDSGVESASPRPSSISAVSLSVSSLTGSVPSDTRKISPTSYPDVVYIPLS